jgi:glycosyltransferase involved in cell wall biosynthesis
MSTRRGARVDVLEAPPKTRPLRVLVMSHAHPRLSHGGAEIAAYRLYESLAALPGCQAWFLGCDPAGTAGRDGVALTQPFGERDYLYSGTGQFDWFKFANRDPRLPGELRALLDDLRPDVVHLHHYVNYGLEALWLIKTVLPGARIVVTLHEFQAICNHFGQMVTTGALKLCEEAGRQACRKCFPAIDGSDFFIRETYIKLFFGLVDHFISPSRFLLERYVTWGIDRARMSVIENIIAPASEAAPAAARDGVLRVGFFGQISRLKGVNVVMECARLLSERSRAQIVIDIFGDYSNQPPQFQQDFLDQLAKCGENVNYRGTYRQSEVDRLMRGVDAVLVPSIWWENSPVVIQEALRNRRPVICSNIGGMAEKVRDGLDGFHFNVGSGLELCYLLQRLHDDPHLLQAVRLTLQGPPAPLEVLEQHITLYGMLLAVAA